MKIKTEELLNALKNVRPAIDVGVNQMIQGTDSFIFRDNGIYGYNDEIAIFYPFETYVEGAVHAEEFIKIIQKITNDELELEIDNAKMKIKSGKVKAAFSIPEHNEVLEMIKSINIWDSKKWKDVPKDFIDGLKLCIYSASNDVTDEELTCINVKGKKVISSDDVRISEYTMKTNARPFLIPAKQAQILIKYPIEKYAISDSWIFFKFENDSIFCCRAVNYTYPDISEHFEFDGETIDLPENMHDGIEIASVMAEEAAIGKNIAISIDNNKVTCRGEGTKGWAEKTFKVDYSKKIEFEINPLFLKQILNETNKIKIGKDRAMFETENFKQLVALRII